MGGHWRFFSNQQGAPNVFCLEFFQYFATVVLASKCIRRISIEFLLRAFIWVSLLSLLSICAKFLAILNTSLPDKNCELLVGSYLLSKELQIFWPRIFPVVCDRCFAPIKVLVCWWAHLRRVDFLSKVFPLSAFLQTFSPSQTCSKLQSTCQRDSFLPQRRNWDFLERLFFI